MNKPNIKTTLQIIDSPEANEFENYEELYYSAENWKEEEDAMKLIEEWKKEKNVRWISLGSLKHILDEFFKEADVDGRQIAFECYNTDIEELYQHLNLPLIWEDVKRKKR